MSADLEKLLSRPFFRFYTYFERLICPTPSSPKVARMEFRSAGFNTLVDFSRVGGFWF